MARRPLVLVAALIAVFALTVQTGPTSAATKSTQPRLRFNDPVALSSFSPVRTVMSHAYSLQNGELPSEHEWSGEPGLEVDRVGNIFVAGVCCVVAASPVWVSRNGGKTFRELRTPAHVREWTIGAEGDLEIDDAGRVFFADTTVPTINFTRWGPQGRKWEFTLPAIGVLPVDDRPWLAWSRPFLYMFINHDAFISVYRSRDGGLLWEFTGPLMWGSGVGGFFPGHIAADRKTGVVWVSGAVPGPGDKMQLGSAVSVDGATTWQQSVVYTPGQGQDIAPVFTGVVTVDDAGTGYTSWSVTSKKGCTVYIASSKDQGQSWSKPIQVSRGPGCATFPWIDASTPGKLAVAYYQTYTTEQMPPTDVPFQDNVPDDAPWHLRIAYLTGANTTKPVIADAQVPFDTPLFLGPMMRQPWDYLGVDLGRDGVIRTVFSEKYRDSAPRNWFVSSLPVR